MQNITARNSRISRFAVMFFGLAVLGLVAVPARAQGGTPAPSLDYGALATSTKDGVISALGAGAPIAFAVLAAMLGLGVVWRLLKRGAKSV